MKFASDILSKTSKYLGNEDSAMLVIEKMNDSSSEMILYRASLSYILKATEDSRWRISVLECESKSYDSLKKGIIKDEFNSNCFVRE